MLENTYESQIQTFVSVWDKSSEKEKVRIVNQTIQKKDPGMNIAIEACRLRDFAKSWPDLGADRRRLSFLMLITVSRLLILGSTLGYAFRGTSTAGTIRVFINSLIDWNCLKTASQALSSEQIEQEYYQWVMRAVQKKQNPLPPSVLQESLMYISDTVKSTPKSV
jgi:hypothetical protein